MKNRTRSTLEKETARDWSVFDLVPDLGIVCDLDAQRDTSRHVSPGGISGDLTGAARDDADLRTWFGVPMNAGTWAQLRGEKYDVQPANRHLNVFEKVLYLHSQNGFAPAEVIAVLRHSIAGVEGEKEQQNLLSTVSHELRSQLSAIKLSQADSRFRSVPSRDGQVNRISIIDQGDGIPEDARANLSDRFEKVGTWKRAASGGTTFHIDLPVAMNENSDNASKAVATQ